MHMYVFMVCFFDCRLYGICVEDDCELEVRKDMTESSCGLFEGTLALIAEAEIGGAGEERELTTLSVVMIM